MEDAQRGGIALEGVSKRFGKHEAVRDVSLSIREGEFSSSSLRRPPARRPILRRITRQWERRKHASSRQSPA
jgi:ABC-type phosphate/phosphonate transport system ATPase subunit